MTFSEELALRAYLRHAVTELKKDLSPGMMKALQEECADQAEKHQRATTALLDKKNSCVLIGEQRIPLAGQSLAVLESLVRLGRAELKVLQGQCGYKFPNTTLNRLLTKHPILSRYITMPGGKGKGGYSTTIKFVDK